ncbi:unnamed protein product [Trichogramma brassicae]|uniref:Uncharacterized protein n=1 Tax=Trichogramma brassicae TaxID=86971 RepID=A0A6H5I7Q6_9HYME|nr:unnamed protein product [Trichogramma brassicae]
MKRQHRAECGNARDGYAAMRVQRLVFLRAPRGIITVRFSTRKKFYTSRARTIHACIYRMGARGIACNALYGHGATASQFCAVIHVCVYICTRKGTEHEDHCQGRKERSYMLYSRESFFFGLLTQEGELREQLPEQDEIEAAVEQEDGSIRYYLPYVTSDQRNDIVDLHMLSDRLWCVKCDHPISLKHITSIEVDHLVRIYTVHCQMCDQTYGVPTSAHCPDYIPKPSTSETTASTSATERSTEAPKVNNSSEVYKRVEGRFIIDLEWLAKKLWCQNCRCPLSLRHVLKFRVDGLVLIFRVRCWECKAEVEAETSSKVEGNENRYIINVQASEGIEAHSKEVMDIVFKIMNLELELFEPSPQENEENPRPVEAEEENQENPRPVEAEEENEENPRPVEAGEENEENPRSVEEREGNVETPESDDESGD